VDEAFKIGLGSAVGLKWRRNKMSATYLPKTRGRKAVGAEGTNLEECPIVDGPGWTSLAPRKIIPLFDPLGIEQIPHLPR